MPWSSWRRSSSEASRTSPSAAAPPSSKGTAMGAESVVGLALSALALAYLLFALLKPERL